MHEQLAMLSDDVERAGRAGAWHAALALALTLPDICSKADPAGFKYHEWCERYLTPRFRIPHGNLFGIENLTAFTGHDCYALRNAYLHAGNDDLSAYRRAADAQLGRIVLVQSDDFGRLGGGRKFQLPWKSTKAEFRLPVGDLCEQIIRSVEQWAMERATDHTVQKNLDRLLTIAPPSASPTP